MGGGGGGFLELFGELKSVDSLPTVLSLTHSPSLAPSTAGLMFSHSLGADEEKKKGKKEKRNRKPRGNVCIFI